MSVQLLPWQERALAAWDQAGRKGIVEAITGSGKSYLGIGALGRLYGEDRRLNTLVVVPTIPLMSQWVNKLAQAFPNRRVGQIGGGHSDDFSTCHFACVAVINSAIRRVNNLLGHTRNGHVKSFLIADECHHYVDAPVFRRIRSFPFHYTLGLSATIDPFEVPGLGTVIFEYGFEDANQDNLVPKFDLVNTGVTLTDSEETDYRELSQQIGEQIQAIKEAFHFELKRVPDDKFFQWLKQQMGRDGGNKDPVIKRLFGLIFKRVRVYYMSERKMALATKLIHLLVQDGCKKVIVFFERTDSADDVRADMALEAAAKLHARVQSMSPIWCRVFHSGLDRAARDRVLNEFRGCGPSAILACRCLDEGIDIPEVDAAVLVASTQSARQRIQRIGRTLRVGDGNKRPIVVTLLCRETRDENVIENDRQIFGDVATFRDADEHNCIEIVRELLRNQVD